MGRPRNSIMRHFIERDNIGLISMRQYAYKVPEYCYSFISNNVVDNRFFISNKGYCSLFPIYLYAETNNQKTLDGEPERKPNLNLEVIDDVCLKTGLIFVAEKEDTSNSFSPTDILDYIYAILHSPTYRNKYKEFLKIDFPRIPYPKDKATFWALVKLGGELRQIHLLESDVVENYITTYPVDGDNTVTRKTTKKD